jgi:hypothetical protein
VCQLINHPEANKKGEWIDSVSYKKRKELFLKDTTRLKSFPTLPMYRDTAGNAVTYEAANKPEGASLVRREYTSPMTRIVLAVTPPSVRGMMRGRMVKIVANMEVSLLLRTLVL